MEFNCAEPLKQRLCTTTQDIVNYSKYIRCTEGNTRVKYLHTSQDEFTGFMAMWEGAELSVHDVKRDHWWGILMFDKELEIVDVEYFPDKDGSMGLLIALNYADKSSQGGLLMMAQCTGGAGYAYKIISKLAIDLEITTLRVVISDSEMQRRRDSLFKNMQQWPHVIVVGTILGHCYIVAFKPGPRVQKDDWAEPLVKNYTDALKSFRVKDNDNRRLFAFKFEGQEDLYNLEVVSVSSLGYLPQTETILIGLTIGGIVAVSLKSCDIKALSRVASRPVEAIATVEAHDDPEGFLWFFAAIGGSKPALCLYMVRPGKTANEYAYDPKLRHVLPFGREWISMRTVVRDRHDRYTDDSCSFSTTTSPLGGKDRSLLFFTYRNQHGHMMGGVFDINSYYYKRLVQRVTPDDTLAKQCGFVSLVWGLDSNEATPTDILDAVMDGCYLRRFESCISTADQLFYPSALMGGVVFVAEPNRARVLALPSLQKQVLDRICEDLGLHLDSATTAYEWAFAVGLIPSHKIAQNEEEQLNMLLSSLIAHDRARSIVLYLKKTDTGETLHIRRQLSEWCWKAISNATSKMEETETPLFAKNALNLAPAGKLSLKHVTKVFEETRKILEKICDVGHDAKDMPEDELVTFTGYGKVASCLADYVKVLNRYVGEGWLPLMSDCRLLRTKFVQTIAERRNKAKEQGRALFIDGVIREMHAQQPERPLWLGQSPTTWYPPIIYNMLQTLRSFVSLSLKRSLLIYYTIDYIMITSVDKMTSMNEADVEKFLHSQTKDVLVMVLDIDSDAVDKVLQRWMVDDGWSKKEEKVSLMMKSEEKDTKLLEDDVTTKLYDIGCVRKLSENEEQQLKAGLLNQPLGIFRWQRYLASNRRFLELDGNLPLPLDLESQKNADVAWYRRLCPLLEGSKKNFPVMPVLSEEHTFSPEIRAAIAAFERRQKEGIAEPAYGTPQRVQVAPKTPIPIHHRIEGLRKRRTSGIPPQPSTTTTEENSAVNTKESSSPPAKRGQFLLDFTADEEPISEQVPLETFTQMQKVLLTPKSKFKAAVAAERDLLSLSVNTTPPEHGPLIPPSSILKSAKKGPASPSRTNRLRFDLPDSSMDSTTIEDNLEIQQPDFDALEDDDDVVDAVEEEDDSVVVLGDSTLSNNVEGEDEENEEEITNEDSEVVQSHLEQIPEDQEREEDAMDEAVPGNKELPHTAGKQAQNSTYVVTTASDATFVIEKEPTTDVNIPIVENSFDDTVDVDMDQTVASENDYKEGSRMSNEDEVKESADKVVDRPPPTVTILERFEEDGDEEEEPEIETLPNRNVQSEPRTRKLSQERGEDAMDETVPEIEELPHAADTQAQNSTYVVTTANDATFVIEKEPNTELNVPIVEQDSFDDIDVEMDQTVASENDHEEDNRVSNVDEVNESADKVVDGAPPTVTILQRFEEDGDEEEEPQVETLPDTNVQSEPRERKLSQEIIETEDGPLLRSFEYGSDNEDLKVEPEADSSNKSGEKSARAMELSEVWSRGSKSPSSSKADDGMAASSKGSSRGTSISPRKHTEEVNADDVMFGSRKGSSRVTSISPRKQTEEKSAENPIEELAHGSLESPKTLKMPGDSSEKIVEEPFTPRRQSRRLLQQSEQSVEKSIKKSTKKREGSTTKSTGSTTTSTGSITTSTGTATTSTGSATEASGKITRSPGRRKLLSTDNLSTSNRTTDEIPSTIQHRTLHVPAYDPNYDPAQNFLNNCMAIKKKREEQWENIKKKAAERKRTNSEPSSVSDAKKPSLKVKLPETIVEESSSTMSPSRQSNSRKSVATAKETTLEPERIAKASVPKSSTRRTTRTRTMSENAITTPSKNVVHVDRMEDNDQETADVIPSTLRRSTRRATLREATPTKVVVEKTTQKSTTRSVKKAASVATDVIESSASQTVPSTLRRSTRQRSETPTKVDMEQTAAQKKTVQKSTTRSVKKAASVAPETVKVSAPETVERTPTRRSAARSRTVSDSAASSTKSSKRVTRVSRAFTPTLEATVEDPNVADTTATSRPKRARTQKSASVTPKKMKPDTAVAATTGTRQSARRKALRKVEEEN